MKFPDFRIPFPRGVPRVVKGGITFDVLIRVAGTSLELQVEIISPKIARNSWIHRLKLSFIKYTREFQVRSFRLEACPRRGRRGVTESRLQREKLRFVTFNETSEDRCSKGGHCKRHCPLFPYSMNPTILIRRVVSRSHSPSCGRSVHRRATFAPVRNVAVAVRRIIYPLEIFAFSRVKSLVQRLRFALV